MNWWWERGRGFGGLSKDGRRGASNRLERLFRAREFGGIGWEWLGRGQGWHGRG